MREIKASKWELAQQLLFCVTAASRPLRVEELAEILAFDFKPGTIPKFHEDWRLQNPVKAILSACPTLLSVVDVKTDRETSRVVQFAHFTVKEFLTSSRVAKKKDKFSHRYHISMSAAHTFVTRACLGVLLHLDKTITSQNLSEFPLTEYAAENWFEHARFEGVSQHVVEGMKQLFDRTKPHLSIWLWIHDPTVPSWKRRERAEEPSPPSGTPLHYAAFCGLQDIAENLAIEHPEDVNSQSIDDGSSPLHLASRRRHIDIVRMLIDRGADVSAQNKFGSTALHLASRDGDIELARILIDRGADMSAQDKFRSTALHLACRDGHLDLGRMLIDCRADMSAQDKHGSTALHLASKNGHVDIVRMLIARGADVSARNRYGWTTLHSASENGNVDIGRMLIERGADVSAEDEYRSTALHLASKNGHIALARMLIEHGADVSAQNEYEWTALHLASENGHVDLARMLEGSTGPALHAAQQITTKT